MRRLILRLTLAALLVGILACDSANPVAPEGTVLTVTASPTQIGLNGSSTITVSGFRPDGNPLNPGTQLNVTTTLGVISPSTLVSVGQDGRASVTLNGDGRQGMATVMAATTGGDVTAMVTVRIGVDPDSKPKVTVSASPATIGLGEDSRITVFVRGPDDAPLGAGLVVELRTTLGTIKNQTTTNAQGEATATLTAGNVPGSAVVTARFGSSDEAMATVTIEERRPSLLISANPQTIRVNETSTITIIARDSNNIPLGAGNRIRLTSSLGEIANEVFTNSNGEAETVFSAGERSGDAVIQAILGNSDVAMVTVTIRDFPDAVALTASPGNVPRTGTGSDPIDLTATVTNALGEPLSGIVVTFRILDGVSGTFGSGGTRVTNSQGLAVETLAFSTTDLLGVMGNIITVEASVAGANQQRETGTTTIRIDG